MRVPYKWLKKYVDIDLTPEELAHQLTMTGLVVDTIESLKPEFSGVVAGEIKSIESHPNADHLVICQVDADKELQLVTGAPNVYEGQMVAVALIGAELPDGMKIRKANFRGVSSEGMLCSAQELGIDVSLVSPEDRDGIITLPYDATPGEDVAKVLGLDDMVLDIELTPNRADCLSIINVAREVAAITGGRLHLPEITVREDIEENIEDLAAVEIEASDLCARYVARLVKNVKIGPSPSWLQACLRSAGMRPINNVVDITNYVMLEMGQPLHAFDYDLLKGHKIVVRRPLSGEKIKTIDGVDRELNSEMLVIADGERPVAVAGIMGGWDTEVTSDTVNILIESAHFDGASIRRTSRKLGLRSEASIRFERGVNLEGAAKAADRAAQLMQELANGQVVQGRIDRYIKERQPVKIELRPERVNYLLGTNLKPDTMKELLERLHLQVSGEGPFQVEVPPYRGDLTQEIDLVEELARLYGYNKIEVTLPGNITSREKQTFGQLWEEAGRQAAAEAGLSEVVTYSFIGSKAFEMLQIPDDHPWRKTVKIKNPLREEQSVLRTSLLPGLLEVATRNAKRRVLPVTIYECGRVFVPTEQLLPDELLRLGGLVMGTDSGGWDWPEREMDFYYLKGILEDILTRLRVKDISFERTSEYPFLHPGRAANINACGEKIGFIGELHPDVLDAADLPSRACVFELDWEKAGRFAIKLPKYEALPRFPAVERDLALVVPADLPAARVTEVIKESGGELLKTSYLFDVYQGGSVPEGYKSLAYSLFYQLPDRTLTDAEVNEAQERIQKVLADKLGATLRQ
ncbi:MAG: phenylalanyl-tRNA synthetase beta chain [Clostridia bacterium]|nr:phenylalanyl-tRNA synthetase beta chain [Clostridia bacterium]